MSLLVNFMKLVRKSMGFSRQDYCSGVPLHSPVSMYKSLQKIKKTVKTYIVCICFCYIKILSYTFYYRHPFIDSNHSIIIKTGLWNPTTPGCEARLHPSHTSYISLGMLLSFFKLHFSIKWGS